MSDRETRCFICARVWPAATMYKLDGWDAMYYVCGPCVDLLKEHARMREDRERDPDPAHRPDAIDWMRDGETRHYHDD
jgi:hypothetical protein